MSKIKVAVPNIKYDDNGFTQILKIMEIITSDPKRNFDFYFSKCSRLDHHGVVMLGGLARYVNFQNTKLARSLISIFDGKSFATAGVMFDVNSMSDFGGDYLTVFTQFFRILESETNELCKDKYTDRTYQYQQTVIRYIWAKVSESTSKHHHLILLFDRDLFQNLGTGREGWGRFLYKKVRKTWDRVVEAYYSQPCSGLAYSPSNEGFELLSDAEMFPLQLNEFFYRVSRFAKPIASRNDHFNKSFGCSHDSP